MTTENQQEYGPDVSVPTDERKAEESQLTPEQRYLPESIRSLPDRNASTQIGQVIQGISNKISEHWPGQVSGRITRPMDTTPSREEMSEMVLALGDPDHPDHNRAVETLVETGLPAIPLLKDALNPEQPWLAAYRAAEVMGRIGNGRATGPLIQALRHPNSNVRWSAVRALAQIGDFRALFELRRVAHEDHGRTSWGESVGGAAQSALEQIQSQGIWSQSMELIKTSFTSVLMILSLILAFSVVTTLRNELQQFGKATPGQAMELVRTTVPMPNAAAEEGVASQPVLPALPSPEAATDAAGVAGTDGDSEGDGAAVVTPTASPTVERETIAGKVLSGANVRPFPSVQNDPIGAVSQGDEIVFLSISPDGMWYRVRLGDRHADDSSIDADDETGWIHRELVSSPKGDVPVEDADDTDTTPAEDDTDEE